jgi:hypothetical protein
VSADAVNMHALSCDGAKNSLRLPSKESHSGSVRRDPNKASTHTSEKSMLKRWHVLGEQTKRTVRLAHGQTTDEQFVQFMPLPPRLGCTIHAKHDLFHVQVELMTATNLQCQHILQRMFPQRLATRMHS